MKRGKFIALEGGEGAGKSTQARLLVEALQTKGFSTDLTREPGGTPGAEAIRQLLLDPPGEGWGAEAEALLFAAARSDHVAQRINPALARGQWVVSDRFVDSSRAYQGWAGTLGDEAIVALHRIGSGGLRPDLTIFLDIDEGTVSKRLLERDGDESDAIGGRDIEYHRAVAAAFRSFASADPGHFAVINGALDQAKVHQQIMRAIEPLLGDR